MPGNPLTDPSYATAIADLVERYVGMVRDRGTNAVVMVARAVVFGLLALFGALASFALAVIGSTRALQALLAIPFSEETAVWVSYFVMGGILCIAGAVCMRLRHSVEDAPA